MSTHLLEQSGSRPNEKKMTADPFEIAVFHGDGIGPEIMAPTLRIMREIAGSAKSYDLLLLDLPAGARHYAETGTSLPEVSLKRARNADAILLSAMGLPDIRYSDGTEISPQIELRMELDLFAGVRPVRIRSGQVSPLKLPKYKSVDFVLIRESTEGLFYSIGSGDEREAEARETLRITRETSEKLFRFAFDLATQRKETGDGPGRVTCVDKANVFRAFAFFRKIFDEEASAWPGLLTDHAYVDAMALWLVQRPWDFDVMVTENMFGDILSDLGAGLMGGLGLAPSADIGEKHAVFQPCHGSAPDIAGLGIANPLAMILSAAMMLEWLGSQHDVEEMRHDGRRLRDADDADLSDRSCLTRDLGGGASTEEVAGAVLKSLFVE